jgi:signal transduction histidine kinase
MSYPLQSFYYKIILTFVLVILVPIIALIAYNITVIRDNQLRLTSEQTLHQLQEQSGIIQRRLEYIREDMRFLSALPHVQQFVASDYSDTEVQAELEQIFLSLAQSTTLYDQLRLLSPEGVEIIRVNYIRDGQAIIVPQTALQDKSDRAYFLENRTLPANEIYISPLELNQERGAIEIPYKPVIRYITPVYTANGELGTLIVLNVNSERLFATLTLPDNDRVRYLVNRFGDFVYTDGSQRDILYATALGRDTTLQTMFPQIAIESTRQDAGVFIDREIDKFLAYTTLTINSADDEFRWILIDEQPLSVVLDTVNASTQSLRNTGIAGLIVAVIVAGFITNSLVKPLRLLQTAVHKLRDHSWHESLKFARMINSRDEVGELAAAFEEMLRELQMVYHTLEQRVTERTQELATANEQLQRLDELKVRFMEDMAHEVRTPLSSISLNMEMISRKPEDYARYVSRVISHIHQIRRLIENVSVVTRLDSTNVKPDFQPMRLEEVVASVVEMYRTAAQEKGLMLNYEPPDATPVIYGHYNQLSQVIDNLITNAIKYTEKGSVNVYLYHDELHRQVCLSVQDSGIGISAEDLGRLFERYYRASNVRQSTIPGTGLGLAIVHEIIQWHNGKIDVQSELGKGTTVVICFPMQ